MVCDSGEEEEEDSEEEDGYQFSGAEEEGEPGASQGAPPPASFQTLTPDMISKKMFEIIDEVNAVFQV